MIRPTFASVLSCALACALASPARAEPAIVVDAAYKAEAMAVVDGGLSRGIRLLDNLDIVLDADLDRLVGWGGARGRLYFLSNQGGAPNDLAGTAQGVSNIEVADHRAKLYEAWIEQDLADGRAALLLGLADLNADFYANDASALLLAPAFGIGSELGATGPNGPSIFPSTALTARLRVSPTDQSYVQAALINARAGVLGDPGGVDFGFDEGALAIAEAGVTGRGKIALGYWRYTERQDDIRALGPAGDPFPRIAQGAYLLAERRLMGAPDGPGLDGFVRLGLSDGKTTPFRGGWQAGLLFGGIVPGRPDSQLSFGVHQAWLSRGYRANARDAGEDLAAAETGFELTYSDRILPFLTVQPDIQYVLDPAGERAVEDALVIGLRLTFEFGSR
ncbi:carbohydrate porin [Sphingomonas sp. LY54]|uniref:carbohydrate porin n=1 Tax=Sphingomonas sp. LY54 TaxID=3095343 RepID=UPI002D77F228|nr:carbohydrate porin [Sphingomonas sp. LY54]WRP27286.1 carbohydrate porin [Sphingomonas sp. LY54]